MRRAPRSELTESLPLFGRTLCCVYMDHLDACGDTSASKLLRRYFGCCDRAVVPGSASQHHDRVEQATAHHQGKEFRVEAWLSPNFLLGALVGTPVMERREICRQPMTDVNDMMAICPSY